MKVYSLDEDGRMQYEDVEEPSRLGCDEYTPEPQYEDLPVNENEVSTFEYYYGEIAFHGVVIVCVYLFVFFLIFKSAP